MDGRLYNFRKKSKKAQDIKNNKQQYSKKKFKHLPDQKRQKLEPGKRPCPLFSWEKNHADYLANDKHKNLYISSWLEITHTHTHLV